MPKTIFLPKKFLFKIEICLRQKIKNGIFALDKKTRLIADFSLDHTIGWGGVSITMIMIGNFRVIKVLT